ncbi:lipoprotein-releasing ABC transporter permease subunit [Aliikangiella maris]|uniref:Lipoprotein-releasing ABC transporter permease subunit n=2 Tax=Aliikangiella maris TaxID=3162458 RepID=A0ABV3MIE3_9GAMM
MKKSVALMVGLRYTSARKSNNFVSFIALVSMLGIALGTIVLITVMSVMNGFQSEMQERILGMVPHVVIGERGEGVKDWQALEQQVVKHKDVIAAAPFIDIQAMFKVGRNTHFGLVQGIVPEKEAEVSIIDKFMKYGKLNNLRSREYGIILGKGLANSLGVTMGDKVSLLIADGATVSPAGISPRTKRFSVVGIFEVKSEHDAMMALIHIDDAAVLTRKGDLVSALRVTTNNVLNAQWTAFELRNQLGTEYYVSDWNYSHGTLFRAIKMEKAMIGILLTFIIAVAAFNIISTLVMVVTDKQADIAILRTLGASPATIMKIFMVQGSVNGIIGTLIGVIGGVALAINLPQVVVFIENLFEVSVIPGDVYFIGFLPSELHWQDVFVIASIALSLTVLATIFPAWKASKTKPAEALRYE